MIFLKTNNWTLLNIKISRLGKKFLQKFAHEHTHTSHIQIFRHEKQAQKHPHKLIYKTCNHQILF